MTRLRRRVAALPRSTVLADAIASASLAMFAVVGAPMLHVAPSRPVAANDRRAGNLPWPEVNQPATTASAGVVGCEAGSAAA